MKLQLSQVVKKFGSIFYNSTNEEETDSKVKKNASQEMGALSLFTPENPEWTASMVWEQLVSTNMLHEDTLLPSIRRALSNLQVKGKIIIMPYKKRMGYFGHKECYYRLIKNNVE